VEGREGGKGEKKVSSSEKVELWWKRKVMGYERTFSP